MPVKVHWLEGAELPEHLSAAGHVRAYRVVSYDGVTTDLVNGADAAKLAFELQEVENAALGISGEHS